MEVWPKFKPQGQTDLKIEWKNLSFIFHSSNGAHLFWHYLEHRPEGFFGVGISR